jgi:cytoskeleton protein RodZ
LTGWRRYLTPDLIIGGSVFIVLFGLVIWGAFKVIQIGIPDQATTPNSIVGIVESTETLEPTAFQAGILPSSTQGFQENQPSSTVLAADLQATLTAVGSGPIKVSIIAYQRAFMRVTVDGNQVINGRTVPGEVYSFSGKVKIILLTGDAAALQVYYNNEDLGVLGQSGQVVSIEFTTKSSATSTPQFPPTATITAAPTLTQRPTYTPSPTDIVPTVTITPAVPTQTTP